MIHKLSVGIRGKCSKNDSQVAVDISGLGERHQDRSGITTGITDIEEENLDKGSKLVLHNKMRIVTYSPSSQDSRSQGSGPGQSGKRWPQKALERRTPT